ncbi:MAG TPA: GFA family protein [Gammaproteobacteria bacterium]
MHPTTPPPSRTASCSCGQLQAQVSGEPVRISVCHCLACQRRTGSVFAVQARFPREAVTVTGASAEYERVGDEGTKATFRFCPKCGAIVYYTADAFPEAVTIPVGAFADPSFPAPRVSVYEERMHSWVSMPSDIEHFA